MRLVVKAERPLIVRQIQYKKTKTDTNALNLYNVEN